MSLKVKGVAQAIKVHGQGTVPWSVLDEAAMLHPRCQGHVVE